ncbi:hypothetical protein BU23DRAFT_555254 [Bimuria novae-zelandiae CBS 107.79]|uniref:Ubiquitin-like domain-containing protein n=1 Tax=Bimuria novae-zelandiae CBS 107.79 TaxID=1447943 RepID=A0A6A5V5T5_9PLEO|nr:hypothetical protein BU23DRAFT_555254 [Bimuria novae-zelandiae CBS 107.79]
MSETMFCRTFLAALDARPVKLSSDHIADARQYPDGAVFVLPKLPSPPRPARPNATTESEDASASSISIILKPMKKEHPTVPLPSITATSTSIYDLKTAYASNTSIPAAKIKILYKKKPVTDSKTVAEVIGSNAGGEVEFGVMVLGGAGAGAAGSPSAGSPIQSPPAVAPGEEEKGLGSQTAAPVHSVAQGPSGKEVVNEEFWSDLKGFLLQRIRDEKEGERMFTTFKSAWEKEQ